jgi:hypothetical protein
MNHNSAGIIYPAALISYKHLVRHLAAKDDSDLKDLGITAERKSPLEVFIERRDRARKNAGLNLKETIPRPFEIRVRGNLDRPSPLPSPFQGEGVQHRREHVMPIEIPKDKWPGSVKASLRSAQRPQMAAHAPASSPLEERHPCPTCTSRRRRPIPRCRDRNQIAQTRRLVAPAGRNLGRGHERPRRLGQSRRRSRSRNARPVAGA